MRGAVLPAVLLLLLLSSCRGATKGVVSSPLPVSASAVAATATPVPARDFAADRNNRLPLPTPVPIPRLFHLTPPALVSTPYERELDPMLDELGVRVVEVEKPDGPYWQVVRVEWHGPQESGGRVRTHVESLDPDGTPVSVGVVWKWATGEARGVTPVDFIMASGGCAYSVWVEDVYPSERVVCLGLGTPEDREYRVHVEYFVTFRLVR